MADEINAFLVRRDEDGKLEPYEVKVLGTQDPPLVIEILPTTIRSLKGLKNPDEDVVKWPIEDKIRYVREHVVKPNFGEVSAEDLEKNMTMWDLDMVLVTAVQYGGPARRKLGEETGQKGPPRRPAPSRRRSRR